MAPRTIGRFADEMGVPVDTVRYYERRGLLRVPDRTPNGYRTYGDGDRARLGFVLRAKALGFTLGEIAELLAQVGGAPDDADLVRRAVEAKLHAVEAHRLELVEVAGRLEQLVALCDGGDAEGCIALEPPGLI